MKWEPGVKKSEVPFKVDQNPQAEACFLSDSIPTTRDEHQTLTWQADIRPLLSVSLSLWLL